MPGLLRKIEGYLGGMDAKSATSVFISVSLLLSVIAIFFLGRTWFGVDQEGSLFDWLAAYRDARWAVLAVIFVFVILALTGFPQILLITATVLAFGPIYGALYSWMATMTSASVTFGLGHRLGGGWVRRFGGDRMGSVMALVARHGIAASGLVRLVPSGPFIAVNAAAGAAQIPFWKFLLGSGFGIIPKIAFVALLGATAASGGANSEIGQAGDLKTLLSDNSTRLVVVAAIVVGWFIVLFIGRQFYLKLKRDR